MKAEDVASQVVRLILPEAEQSNMLPLTCEEVLDSLQQGTAAYIAQDGLVIAYASVKLWPGCQELRSIVVHPEFRGWHYGTAVVAKTVVKAQAARDLPVIALTNRVATGLCHKLGFREADRTKADPALWADCVTCLEWGSFPYCHCRYLVLPGTLYDQGDRRYAILDLSRVNGEDLAGAAAAYCQVWQEPPWNEFDWKPEEVAGYLKGIAKRRGGVALVAVEHDETLGFSAGWSIDENGLYEKVQSMRAVDYLIHGQRAFYVAELGCLPEGRGRGIGWNLTETLLAKAEAQGYRRFVLRTHRQAAPARALYAKAGFRETEVEDPTYPDRTYWVR